MKNEITQPDLFGGDTIVIEGVCVSFYKRFKIINNYRKSYDFRNCGSCENSGMWEVGSKNYRKCKLMGVSHGPATDVSNRYVCNSFQINKK